MLEPKQFLLVFFFFLPLPNKITPRIWKQQQHTKKTLFLKRIPQIGGKIIAYKHTHGRIIWNTEILQINV